MSLNLRSLAFNFVKRLTTRKFPTVRWITTKELARWFEDTSKSQPIVLDARSEAEYTISHLKKAQHIDPKVPNLETLARFSRDTPIVVYCSVGYRSARIAKQLGQAGFSHVYNLEGSLFQWANEGRQVFQNERPTTFVHPYNQRWGKLLKSQHRAPLSLISSVNPTTDVSID